jgi:hypothetical protein
MNRQSTVDTKAKEAGVAAPVPRRENLQQMAGGAPAPVGVAHAAYSFGGVAVYPPPGQLAIQARLTVGPVDDAYEREADHVAAQVVSGLNAPPVQRQGEPEDEEQIVQAKPAIRALQRQPAPEEEDEALQMKRTAQRQVDGSGEVDPPLEGAIQQRRGGGQALPDATRHAMEQAIGADFGRVRVHSDAQSDRLNRSIQARAFTTGQDIFMRQGEYQPQARSGQELLAHELTHVVQQTQTRSPAIQRMLWTFSNNAWRDRDWQVGNPQGLPLLNPKTQKPWKEYDAWNDGLDEEDEEDEEEDAVEHPEFTEEWGNAHGYAYDLQLSPQVGVRYDKSVGNAGGAHKPKGRILVHNSGNYAISADQDEHAGQAWKAHYKVGNKWAYAGTYGGNLQKLDRPVGTGPHQLPVQ